MEFKTTVGVSNRHVHLTQEVFTQLFGTSTMEHLRDLNQIGQFASQHTVTLKNGERCIPNVRVLGPFRSYNQVEISKTDAYTLKLNPPIRTSGDLDGAETITLCGPCGEVTLPNSCIIANRHLHINTKDVEKYHVTNKQKITVHVNTEKPGDIEAFVKVSDDGYFELHLDTDDANAFLLTNGDEVTVSL